MTRSSAITASAALPKKKASTSASSSTCPVPKCARASFGNTPVDLPDGHICRLTVGHDRSTADVIEVEYDSLLEDIQIGDRLVLGDGKVQLDVREKQADKLVAEIISGGEVVGRPGVHIPSDRLSISTPTPDDLRAIDAFVDVGVDMIALSFVRSAHDVRRVGTELYPRGPLVIAKIETRGSAKPRRHHRCRGRHHGGTRRSRQRVHDRRVALPTKADHP